MNSDNMMGKLPDRWVIHIFVLMHAAVAFASRLVGFSDTLVLTLLTMLLAAILCQRRRVPVLPMTLILIFVNIAGYYLVSPIAYLLRTYILQNRLFSGPLTTMIVTEILGWSTLGITVLIGKREAVRENDSQKVKWLMLAFIVVITIRLVLILLDSRREIDRAIGINIVIDYLFCNIVVFYLAYYSVRGATRAEQASRKANQAMYSYQRLKQQVEPHFMFNNLNVLNGLVCENDNEAASLFIRKLAGIYRYMIDSESVSVVTLQEEMQFVYEYVDLLNVRFGSALSVSYDVPDEYMSCCCVPCAVQLLIENAVKHNIVTEDNPLMVIVAVADGYVSVKNRRCPKLTSEPSTGVGLKYIRRQYSDVCGKDIVVFSDEFEFNVKLPLIYNRQHYGCPDC